MRRYKTIFILLGVLVVLCIGTFAVSKIETKKENIRTSGETFLSIDPEQVTALSWKTGDSNFSFTKSDDKWTYDSDAEFPVNQEKIEALLGDFKDLGATFTIEDADSLGQYGLSNPQGTITITAGDETYTISLGDYSTMDSQRYVSIGDGKVYLSAYDPMDDFSVELKDLIQNDEIPYFDTIDSATIAGDEDYTFKYEENSSNTCCPEDVYFDGNKPLDTDAVDGYLYTLSGIKLNDYATYKAQQSDLEKYCLSDPDLCTTINYTEKDEDGNDTGKSFTFSIGCDKDALEKAEENEDTSNITAYFRAGDSPIIYKISADDYKNLMACTYNDLRHKDIVSADMDKVYKVDITLDGELYTLTREEDPSKSDDEQVWKYNDEEIDFTDFSNAVKNLSADSFVKSGDTQKQEIAVKLYLNDDNFPEINVELYRYDGTDCVARVNGTVVALVPREQVVNLTEAVNAIVLGSDKQ